MEVAEKTREATPAKRSWRDAMKDDDKATTNKKERATGCIEPQSRVQSDGVASAAAQKERGAQCIRSRECNMIGDASSLSSGPLQPQSRMVATAAVGG